MGGLVGVGVDWWVNWVVRLDGWALWSYLCKLEGKRRTFCNCLQLVLGHPNSDPDRKQANLLTIKKYIEREEEISHTQSVANMIQYVEH